jgi:hypothetical protein
MTAFVHSAKYMHEVESGLDYVEISYTRYVKSEREYVEYTEYLNTRPVGEWVEICSLRRNIPYEKFLDCMVEKTLEVRQRIVQMTLRTLLDEKGDDSRTIIRAMHSMKVLDRTFTPPYVNRRSPWQMDLAKHMCESVFHDLIEECLDEDALDRLYLILRLLLQ